MSSTDQSTNTRHLSVKFNRIMYGAFVLLSAYFLATGSYHDAAVNLGIGLIFDPFDQTVRWDNRPRWQRVWLIIHLVVIVGIVVYWKASGAQGFR
ncbi:hypothetical protein [Spirosoma linguale]|uniref:Uncharacterized protein n=1 Tax=Spirosoma linguale (strain ATCC 33905 / DSM 74 / LMG 10896 / Claus 1) TaxID=504472 RepID=D2QIE4_SPILD|nr:hypothetical protein Slin_2712 [Spirosoma linguale DSM 74]